MNTTRSDTTPIRTPKWKHPDVPGTSGVYPAKKHNLGDLSRRWQPRPTGEALSHPACAGLDHHSCALMSTIHVAQGTEIFLESIFTD
jgi:hypothetical protein